MSAPPQGCQSLSQQCRSRAGLQVPTMLPCPAMGPSKPDPTMGRRPSLGLGPSPSPWRCLGAWGCPCCPAALPGRPGEAPRPPEPGPPASAVPCSPPGVHLFSCSGPCGVKRPFCMLGRGLWYNVCHTVESR